MRTAAEHGGMYISHLRSEANQLLEAIDKLITIAARVAAMGSRGRTLARYLQFISVTKGWVQSRWSAGMRSNI
jgi:hypothetical protein